MKNKKYLFNFLEKINTECDEISILNKKAIKLDGEKGVKTHLGLNISSCDYISLQTQNKNISVYLIEITDLKKQIDNLKIKKKFSFIDLENEIVALKNIYAPDCEKLLSKLDKKLKTLKSKEIKNVIKNELRKKIIESLVLFMYFYKHFYIKEGKLTQFKFKVGVKK